MGGAFVFHGHSRVRWCALVMPKPRRVGRENRVVAGFGRTSCVVRVAAGEARKPPHPVAHLAADRDNLHPVANPAVDLDRQHLC